MANPFLGEIKMVPFNFAPRGWTFCNGQQLPINQNQALFSLLGTTYGGNGVTTFALPNLQGCTPLHFGSTPGSFYQMGQIGGEVAHTLSSSEMPAHSHLIQGATRPGTATAPGNNVLAAHRGGYANASDAPTVGLNSRAVSSVGGNQPHNNLSPYLVISFVIALTGVFPSRN
ncbi:MAG TPA: tail fiber protein [Usitatibacter sp.]|jgi:microcystin-dependent protein|nr:tail fiber protein [Usitatibacter sp.]